MPDNEMKIRTLSYLQILVEEKEVPCYNSNQTDLAQNNVYMVQGMEHTDERGVILLTAPKPLEESASAEERKQTAKGEGFKLLHLTND